MPEDYIEDILQVQPPTMPVPGLTRPQQQAFNDQTVEDILGIGNKPESVSLSQTLKDGITTFGFPLLNAAIGAKFGPVKAAPTAKWWQNPSVPGGLMGLANTEQPLNATNFGTVADALTRTKLGSKLLPTEARKQAAAAVAPGIVNIARSENWEDVENNALLSLLGVGAQAGLGKISDSARMDERGYRGAVPKINAATKQMKDVMKANPNNKQMGKALAAQDILDDPKRLTTAGVSVKNTPKLQEQAQVFQQHPEVLADIKKLRAQSSPAKQVDINKNPIQELASQQLDELLPGTHVKTAFSKSNALAKLRSYRQAAPDSTQIEQAYVSRVHKDLNLRALAEGKADPGKVKRILDSAKLSADEKKVIFGDLQRGNMFEEVLDNLYEAAKQSSATINIADHVGSTMGATGLRVGIMGALVDLNAWRNLLGRKDYVKQQKAALKTLQLINNPSRIRELEVQTGRRGLTASLVRTLATTLMDNANNSQSTIVPEENDTTTLESPIKVVVPDDTIVRGKQ